MCARVYLLAAVCRTCTHLCVCVCVISRHILAELENHLVIMQDSYPDENRQLFFPTRKLRKAGKKSRFPFVPTLGPRS